ncbi:MAG: ATP-binding protein, partial [Asticcacaulis sp.]|nr:ATP-binding protein [Asticcacaulis sp.]
MKVEIRFEQDVVLARRRARQIARQLGFGAQDQIRIATAVSELARNIFQYTSGGRVEFLIEQNPGDRFKIVVSDHGPGIVDVDLILSGGYRSKTGMGLGLLGAKRLVDEFSIMSS